MTQTFTKTLKAINNLNKQYSEVMKKMEATRTTKDYNDFCVELAAISERISFLSKSLQEMAQIQAEIDYEISEYDSDKRCHRTKNFVDEYKKVCENSKID